MNIGAKADDPATYNVKSMKADVNPSKLEDPAIKNMIVDQMSDTFNWIDQRANNGDNIPLNEFDQFHKAVLNDNAEKAVVHAVNVLETSMNPTARDIIGHPIKQFVYNVCGKRAYRYKNDE